MFLLGLSYIICAEKMHEKTIKDGYNLILFQLCRHVLLQLVYVYIYVHCLGMVLFVTVHFKLKAFSTVDTNVCPYKLCCYQRISSSSIQVHVLIHSSYRKHYKLYSIIMLPSHQEAALKKVLMNEWSPSNDAITLWNVQKYDVCMLCIMHSKFPLLYDLNVRPAADPGCD